LYKGEFEERRATEANQTPVSGAADTSS
jgi:hypothetical protein